VEELGLPTRALRRLIAAGVLILGELVRRTPQERLALEGFGVRSLQHVRRRLAELGHALEGG
jgi:DNA-directed RNA polymerase alpha subunit